MLIDTNKIVSILYPLLNKKGRGIDGHVYKENNVYYSTNRHVLVKLTLKKSEDQSSGMYKIDGEKQIIKIENPNFFHDINTIKSLAPDAISPLSIVYRVNNLYLTYLDKILNKLSKGYHAVKLGQAGDDKDKLVMSFENEDIEVRVFIMRVYDA